MFVAFGLLDSFQIITMETPIPIPSVDLVRVYWLRVDPLNSYHQHNFMIRWKDKFNVGHSVFTQDVIWVGDTRKTNSVEQRGDHLDMKNVLITFKMLMTGGFACFIEALIECESKL